MHIRTETRLLCYNSNVSAFLWKTRGNAVEGRRVSFFPLFLQGVSALHIRFSWMGPGAFCPKKNGE